MFKKFKQQIGSASNLIIIILVIAVAFLIVGALFLKKTNKPGTALTTPNPTVSPSPTPTSTPPIAGQITVNQSSGSSILIAECADRNYINNTADYIIEGTVTDVNSKWDEGRTFIYTFTDLQIEKYIKGSPFVENKLQIKIPGGTVEGISQYVEDQPIFYKTKKVIIYFKWANGEFSILCGTMGVEEI